MFVFVGFLAVSEIQKATVADLPSGAYYLILENKEDSIVQVVQWTKN
ncbi:MAG: hypothetical protein Q7T20_02840 [Saprospiraceae bacterium]|nr:hypothetical protein [Saprospiraceae bacterium]